METIELEPVSYGPRPWPQEITDLLDAINDNYDVPTLTHVGEGLHGERVLVFSNDPVMLEVVSAPKDEFARNFGGCMMLFVIDDEHEIVRAHRTAAQYLADLGVDDYDDLNDEQGDEYFRLLQPCFNIDENTIFANEQGEVWDLDDDGYLTVRVQSSLF